MRHSVTAVLCGVVFVTFVRIIWAECGGKTAIYDLLKGTISIAPEKYPANTYCEWLIKAPRPGQSIMLTFREFDTECSFDILKIYDGSSSHKLLGAFSGNTIPRSLVSNTSSIVLEFFSDNNYVRHGGDIDFVITDCPGDCSGHGSCFGNKCSCDELYTGEACDVEICPQLCNNATGNGQCSQSNGCQCNADFIGQSCSFSLRDDVDIHGSWHLIRDRSSVFQSRFGHAGVYVEHDNAFWIFGGSSLNEVLDDLVKFNFDANNWQLIQPIGYRPAARYRHTLVTYKDTLVVFGGQLANGTLLNDLWIFNITTSTWRRMKGNNVDNPPALASHCAIIHDGDLIVFGGQTEDYGFSSNMYTYDLVLQNGWKRISYKLAKISDLRLVGHTCVFYPALRSLVVFGGYRLETGRQSNKVDTVLLYHVDGKVWLPMVTSGEAKPTAYHSAVIIGDYMVTYGGVVHTHYEDETCYGDDLYLLNLKNFTWLSTLSTDVTRNGSWSNVRGRYSHVAGVLNKSTLLIAGGFCGVANGDLWTYRIPSEIIRGDFNSIQKCHTFTQCVPCLTWGSQSDLLCGWCVQDSRCYPRSSPSGPCSSSQTTRGWWGDKGSFLTTVDQCRIEDYPPGLMSNIMFKNIQDDIDVVNPLQKILKTNPRRLTPASGYDINVKWFGFIYPFMSQSTKDPVSLMLWIGGISASLHLSVNESDSHTEKVISFKSSESGVVRYSSDAIRTASGLPLFPNAAENKMYYMEVKAEFKGTTKDPRLSVLMNEYVIDGRYVRPYYSDDCGIHTKCLDCLTDASCGWCSSSNTCMHRNSSMKCHHSSGEDTYLVLNATYCETCAQFIDCESCSKDDLCIWRTVHERKLYDRCDTLRSSENKNEAKQCAPLCTSHNDCGSCIKDTKCLWCENQHKCIPWISHPVGFINGQCSDWSDILTSKDRCSSCSELDVCADCRKTRHCGWCGEFHNGSCFAGGFHGPDTGSCNQMIPLSGKTSTYNSYNWSYAECPDENECITRNDCDKNADCFNTIGSYRCECRQGYEGDGSFCKAMCNPPCVHGDCIKHEFNDSLDKCDCELGWTGQVCSLDCGCHNHSTCHTGIGVCDNCQELTHGKNCEFCVPGSYGDVTNSVGCTKCECNGHGDEQRGICDDKTGQCFCMNSTMGTHCDQCLPGFFGHPEKGEACYYPCRAHSVLTSITQGTLSSLPEPGENHDPNNVNCVWIITTITNEANEVVYSSSNPPAAGTITLRMKDIALDCQTDHVYVYDGMPNFKLSNVDLVGIESSSNLIGSLCGSDSSNVPAIESRSGTLVVVFKGNVGHNSLTNGFNASFVVNQCPNACTGNRYCRSNGTHESCVCKAGRTGSTCDHVKCPANCSEDLGQGYCDQNSGKCVCKNGFVGPSCNIKLPFDDFVWEYISDESGSTPSLARMGHTLVADVQTESLIIYGGYSLYFAVLGDVWTFDTKKRNYVQDYNWHTKPNPRYFHAACVYKRTMYVTGGITEKGYSSEVWKYDLDAKQWQEAQILPREMAGHTLNIVNDTMYLIGGYSPGSQCSSKVYTLKLDVVNSPWSELNPSGDLLDVCFGHTSVYDRLTKSLVVFGKKALKMEPTLALLKLTTNEWVVVPDVPQALLRYFHVSMIVGDIMIVTTGYTGYDIQDFADKPLVYDLRCGSWHKPDLKGTVPSFLTHSALALMNEETYVFGGYNGVSSDKLFHQNISSNWCSVFSTELSCSSVSSCIWCKNTTSNLTACYVSDSPSHLNCSISNNACQNGGLAMPIASAMTSWNDVCFGKSVPGGCSSCIQAGSSSTCSWSVDSHLCFSLSFQPITCAFGTCGRVLRDYDVCPESCNRTSYCYDCLEQYNCGWCADQTQNGHGICTEGTLQSPYNGTCNGMNDNLATWVSSVCLPENECVNGHHDCNENETCLDLALTYKCECSPGYERRNGSCKPVCSQGCVKGMCIQPETCSCFFGWVGANCSTACQCHDKGRCVNESQLDHCTDCQSYTAGISCQFCLPGYVGHNGQCSSCYETCHRNAEICYDQPKNNATQSSLFGPTDKSRVECECNDNSEGKLCENCKTGFFHSPKKCVKCKCRGHAAWCDEKTGTKCKCQNQTKTPDNAGNNKQCSMCILPYRGNPEVEGQQCYRDLRILGHLSLPRQDSKHSRLLPFQTSFFYIFPSYTNADIRLTIDIYYGSPDVYISHADNAFKVNADQNVSISLKEISSPELYSDGLNVYSTFSGNTQVAVFKEIKHRLVVTFPYDEHPMDKKKFYIVIKAGRSGADGMLYFKQDSTKINLIVFFIVFASCFIFLLSGVSIGWIIKNHVHSRQEVHNLEVENIRLHNRPFAQFAFLFEYQSPAPSVLRHRKTTASTRKAVRAMGVQCTSDYHATVTTVIFQMPQTEKTKMSVSLGTTLALVSPQQLDKLAQPSAKWLGATTNL